MKSIRKIGVISAYPFPEGMASTTRIIAYCHGLLVNNVEAEVFTFNEVGIDSGAPRFGFAQGVKYHNCFFSGRSGILRNCIDKPKILSTLYKQIRESHKVQKFDFIFLSFDDIDFLFLILPLLRILSIRPVFIGDEFPRPIRQLKTNVPYWRILCYKMIHKFIDARVLMTESLSKFYNEEISLKPTYILNSVIDERRFANISNQKVEQKYLCYMGNMMLAKDNVDNIVNAFALIANVIPDYQLWLFGNPNTSDRKIIENLISEHHLEGRVFLMGRVDYLKVPQILANATLLLTSQPKTKRAEGGFPTKMAEYMMSRTPMIVTNVGEICNYVQDGVTSYVVEPHDALAYSNKIRYILSHPDESQDVAERAYNYAVSHFCSSEVTKGLISFLSEL